MATEIHNLTNPDQIDVYLMMVDAIEIANTDDMEFQEQPRVVPPAYMINAAAKGLKLRDKYPIDDREISFAGLVMADKIANQKSLTIGDVKRIYRFCLKGMENVNCDPDPHPMIDQGFLLYGVIPTRTGLQRVINWCERTVKRLDKDMMMLAESKK